jgi:hypothetical protein
MTTIEIPAAEVEDPEGGSSPVLGEGGPGGGLVLPEEVLATLAAQLAGQARSSGGLAWPSWSGGRCWRDWCGRWPL